MRTLLLALTIVTVLPAQTYNADSIRNREALVAAWQPKFKDYEVSATTAKRTTLVIYSEKGWTVEEVDRLEASNDLLFFKYNGFTTVVFAQPPSLGSTKTAVLSYRSRAGQKMVAYRTAKL